MIFIRFCKLFALPVALALLGGLLCLADGTSSGKGTGKSGAKGEASELWGANGEKWKDSSRLPDFSHAGYCCGEKPIPQVPVVTDVKKHGAAGNGTTDDTKAFLAAVAAVGGKGGAIFIPAGRYVLTDVVTISQSNVVLRGAGPDKTILVIPKPLAEIHPSGPVDQAKSKYAFSGGFIAIHGRSDAVKVTELAAAARRGDRQLTLKQSGGFRAGDYLRVQSDNSEAIGRLIHADQLDVAKQTCLERKNFIDWVARVVSVDGAKVTLDRPLRLDLHKEWNIEITTWRPRLQDVGVEDLSFEFAGVPKKPHLKEDGFNAIHMTGAANSWVRNVTIIDADNGVIVGGCRFCRIEKVTCRAAKRKTPTGHHALWATGGSQDCLFTDFDIDTQYVHDLTVEGFANGNVFMKGKGQMLNFDHHRNAPYENLFTELNVGNPRRLWESSGRGDRGPHAGARETVWNLECRGGQAPQAVPDWPQLNVIGVAGYKKQTIAEKQWIEPCEGNVEPGNLYEAQLQKRLGRKPAEK